jgi:hypothetical protein
LFPIHFWKFEKLSRLAGSNSSKFLQKSHRQNRKTHKKKKQNEVIETWKPKFNTTEEVTNRKKLTKRSKHEIVSF